MQKGIDLILSTLTTGIHNPKKKFLRCTYVTVPFTINLQLQPVKTLIYISQRLRKVITAYNGSISATLIALFPEIGLAKSKFLQSNFLPFISFFVFFSYSTFSFDHINIWTVLWRDRSVRRRFMENYAQRNGFDPLTPYHWYSTLDDLSATKVCLIYNQYYSIFIFIFVLVPLWFLL